MCNYLLFSLHETTYGVWFSYKAHRLILLRGLEGAMRLYRSEDTSVHVLACDSYDFNALTPVMWKLWR